VQREKDNMASLGTYIKEAYDELINKVTWPSWKNLQQSAVLVFVASLLIALTIWAMDFVFGINKGGEDGESFFRGILGMIYELIS